MIKIIKDNTQQFNTICECCGSELEYNQGDIFELSFQYDHLGFSNTANDKPYVITCPACEHNTRVPKFTITR